MNDLLLYQYLTIIFCSSDLIINLANLTIIFYNAKIFASFHFKKSIIIFSNEKTRT